MHVEVRDSIADIPEPLWDGLAARGSRPQTHAFWRMVEQSGLNDFRYRYALFRDDDGRLAAVAAFYSISTDIAIFAPPWLRVLLGGVRRLWPRFLMMSLLECGTPVTLTSPPFVVADPAGLADAIATLDRLLYGLARKERHFLVIVRDFETNATDQTTLFGAHGYHIVDSLPNSYLDIRWTAYADYLASMKSYFRSKVVKHLKRNAVAAVRCEHRYDFGPLAETLLHQWMVVHDHADEFQREMLTADFYRNLDREVGHDSSVLLFYCADVLVGHALLLRDGDKLRWLYFGRETEANDSLYIFVIQSVIRTAIETGAKLVEMGLTT
jgi:predicted N-acyltransferase